MIDFNEFLQLIEKDYLEWKIKRTGYQPNLTLYEYTDLMIKREQWIEAK